MEEDLSVVGKVFEAQIIHEPDKDDPTKTWSRIANIKVDDDIPPPDEPDESGDEVPF